MNHYLNINKENCDSNIIKLEITPIKHNNNLMHGRNNHKESDLNHCSFSENIEKKQNLRGRKKKRLSQIEETIDFNDSLNKLQKNISSPEELFSTNFKLVQETNLNIFPLHKMKIIHNRIAIKFTAIYNKNSIQKFPELWIKSFSNKEQTEKLKEIFSSLLLSIDYLTKNYICSFSQRDLESCPAEMFEIISKLKLENKFCILSNRLKEDEILILLDTKNISYTNYLKNYDFAIIAIKENILYQKLQIQKSSEYAIIHMNKDTSEQCLTQENPCDDYYHYDIFALQNDVDEYLGTNFSKTLIKNLKKENCSLNKELKQVKEEDFLNKRESLFKEQILSNVMTQMQLTCKRIESEYKIENNSLIVQLEEANKKLVVLNEDEIGKENLCLKSKLEYLEIRRKCSVDYVDGFIIESRLEDNPRESELQSSSANPVRECFDESQEINIIPERLLCIICLTNLRDCLLTQCSHTVYCEKCVLNIFPVFQSKTGKSRKHIIECPICKTVNKKYIKMIYS